MERKEAYIYAIENEIKSANLYRALAGSFNDPELVKTFNSLTVMENLHQEKLKELFFREYGNQPLTYDKKIIPKPDIRRNLSDPKSVLEYAVDREIAMADQYRYMADESEDKEIKEFFLSLVEEEKNHKDMLETELDRIQGTMIWFDPSELNGLMDY